MGTYHPQYAHPFWYGCRWRLALLDDGLTTLSGLAWLLSFITFLFSSSKDGGRSQWVYCSDCMEGDIDIPFILTAQNAPLLQNI